MKSSRLVVIALMLGAAVAVAQPRPKPFSPKPAPAAAPVTPARSKEFIGSVLDTGQFLPDTALLASVGDRRITVRDFIDSYFASYPEYRPRPDSDGRREFLTSMVNKEILGLTALSAGREFGFEERLTMRAFTQRVLSNAVYQRYVLDSVNVPEADIRALYEMQKYEQHFRHILFTDRALATKVSEDLRAGRMTWDAAFKRYHAAKGTGDLGWVSEMAMPSDMAIAAFGLPVGGISDPVPDKAWFHVLQSVERRPAKNVSLYESVRRMLRTQLVGLQTSQYAERIQSVLRARIGLTYDTAAVRWVSSRFGSGSVGVEAGPLGTPEFTISDTLPAFSNSDTSRVLATWNGGRLTLAPVLKAYSDITPVSRPMMNTPEAVQTQIDALVLEPYMAEFAVEHGLDKDPLIQQQLLRKREEILVKHMFSDSVESRIWISKPDRQKYYQQHPADFTTFPAVEFAAFTAHTRGGADSLAARLRAGESARAILLADSLAGIHRGSIQSRNREEHGPYHKVLFEELRPGQVSVDGPDREGTFLVLQLLTFDPGHLLPYEQVEGMIDESLQNIRAEESLKNMLARASKRYHIVTRPELLDRVRLVDSTLDE